MIGGRPVPVPAALREARPILLGALVAVGTDLASKALVTATLAPHQPHWLIPALLGVERVSHAGAWQGRDAAAVAAITVLVPLVAITLRRLSPRRRAAVALLTGITLGGVVANAAERIRHGYVTDWILVHLPGVENLVGNVADAAILLAGIPVIAITWTGLVGLGTDRRRAR